MAKLIEIKVPDIGDFKEVGVIEILVKPGDAVQKETSLITVESDKATMEIPSPAAGVVSEVKVKLGDKIAEGSLILTIFEETQGQEPVSGENTAIAQSAVPAPAIQKAPTHPAAPAPAKTSGVA